METVHALKSLCGLVVVLLAIEPVYPTSAACSNISAPSFGTVECKDVNNLLVCTGFCQHGYKFESFSPIERRICIKDVSVWMNGQKFSPCRPVYDAASCQSLSPPSNGVVRCESVDNRIKCTAKCNDKYMFETQEAVVQRICDIDTGIWFQGETFPSCIKNETVCSRPLSPDNGIVKCEQNLTHVSCTAICQPGFLFSTGQEVVSYTCDTYSGIWSSGSPEYPSCQKSNSSEMCQVPMPNKNTKVQCMDTKAEIICVASCSNGYRLDSNENFETIVCDKYDGNWFNGKGVPQCLGSCDHYLITSNSAIKDSDFNVSSWLNNGTQFSPERAKIDSILKKQQSPRLGGGWRPKVDNLNQYIQIKLQNISSVVGIVIKGLDGSDAYVTRFRVLYSIDGQYFVPYSDRSVLDKFFSGNMDGDTPVTISFSCPFDAKFVRINPLEWHNHIGLRFDLLGCDIQEAGQTTIKDTSTESIQPTIEHHNYVTMSVPQNKCSPLLPPQNGIVNCEKSDQDLLVCSAICKAGFSFDSSEPILKRSCDPDTGVWSPEKHYPPCNALTEPTSESATHLQGNCIAKDIDCRKRPNGDYQACGDCHYFTSCSEGYLYVRPCPVNLVFDSTMQKCLYNSNTCAHDGTIISK